MKTLVEEMTLFDCKFVPKVNVSLSFGFLPFWSWCFVIYQRSWWYSWATTKLLIKYYALESKRKTAKKTNFSLMSWWTIANLFSVPLEVLFICKLIALCAFLSQICNTIHFFCSVSGRLESKHIKTDDFWFHFFINFATF